MGQQQPPRSSSHDRPTAPCLGSHFSRHPQPLSNIGSPQCYIHITILIKCPLRRVVAREVDALARLAGGVLVELDVLVELGGLLVNLGAVVLAVDGLVDLQSQDLKLELQHLVLNLTDLQGVGSVAGGSIDGVIEATGVCLGRLGGLTSRLDNVQVGGINVGQVVLINLR